MLPNTTAKCGGFFCPESAAKTGWIDAALVVLITAILQFGGETFYLDINQQGVSYALGWLTGHWVHLNWNHYVLDVGTLIMLMYLLRPRRTEFWLISAVLPIGVSAALIGLDQLESLSITRYAGLSGVLHGLCVFFAASRLLDAHLVSFDRMTAWLLLVGAVIKVALEQIGVGVSVETEQLIGAVVVTQAHLDGVVIAGCLFLLYRLLAGRKKAG